MSSRRRFFKNTLPTFKKCGFENEDEIIAKHRPHILKQIEQILQLLRKNVKPLPQNEDGGLYVGISGISYGLFYASQSSCLDDATKKQCLDFAGDLLEASLEYCYKMSEEREKRGVAFLLGHLGVYAYASVYFAKINKPERSREYLNRFISLHEMCVPLDFLKCGGDELLVGRAGYLCGSKFICTHLGCEAIPKPVIQKIIDSILESGRRTARKLRVLAPLMYTYYESRYIGAAHGLSGILQMLMTFPSCLDEHALSDIRKTTECLASLETEFNNYPVVMNEAGRDLYHWCHGSPGVIYCLVKAQQVLQDPAFNSRMLSAAGDNLWRFGLLRKGPGICHGVSGNAYAFLLLYRCTGQLKYLYQAHAFGQFMFTEEFMNEARQPDNPFSLFEGWAGTLCFLVDLLQPNQAHFPFFDVLS